MTDRLPNGMSNDLIRVMREIFGGRLLSIVLYGSTARGEQTEGSDIDVAVFLNGPLSKDEKRKMLSVLVDLDWKYDCILSVNDIEQATFNQWADVLPYYRNIKKDGIVLWKAA